MAKVQNYIGIGDGNAQGKCILEGVDTALKKRTLGGGDKAHTLLLGAIFWVGTPQKSKLEQIDRRAG